jgi:hypothetical protein
MITVLIMNVIFWVVNFKIQNYFVISTTQNVYLRLSMYDCPNFVHIGFLEYLSFKQFKLIVKMTRIGSGVTIPKGLFTLYLQVKKVTLLFPSITRKIQYYYTKCTLLVDIMLIFLCRKLMKICT